MDEQLDDRLDRFERTLAALQDELAELRRLAGQSAAATRAAVAPLPPPS